MGDGGRRFGLVWFLIITVMIVWSLPYLVARDAPKMEIDRRADLSMMDRSIDSPAYSSRSGTSKRVVGRQTHLSTKKYRTLR